MKKIIAFIAAAILYCNISLLPASPNPFGWKYKYCAEMKNGKLTVMNEGKALTADVMLANGTKVMTDGTIMMKDGTKRALTEGECVDKDGTILTREQMKKAKPEYNTEK